MPSTINTHICKCLLEDGRLVNYDYCTHNRDQDSKIWEYLGKGVMYSCAGVIHDLPQDTHYFFNYKRR